MNKTKILNDYFYIRRIRLINARCSRALQVRAEFKYFDSGFDEYEEFKKKSLERLINAKIRFGEESLLNNLFFLDKKWLFLNHGAFGATLKILLKESLMLREICERQPLLFTDRILNHLILNSIHRMAFALNCPSDELIPIQNCTFGMNSIVKSIKFNPDDEIVCLSITYKSTKIIMSDVAAINSIHFNIINISFPIISKIEFLSEFKRLLKRTTKLIVLDEITSYTAIKLPVLEMAVLCRQVNPNMIIVIDGAHSLFAQDVRIYPRINDKNPSSHQEITKVCTNSIGSTADFYLMNCHKWLCSPKGCGFLWHHPRTRAYLKPAVLSNDYKVVPHDTLL